MADDKKTLKFQMMMSPAEADILDDWMFKNRVRSRAEAIRRLTQIALATEPLVTEFKDLWRKIGFADGQIGSAIIDAYANLDHVDAGDLVKKIDQAYGLLTSPTLEFGLQAAKLETAFDALKAGEDVEAALHDVEDEYKKLDKTTLWVKNSWGKKPPEN